jgi:hypothetical protein
MANRRWPLNYCGPFLVEALIWTQSNSDLEEYAGKVVRQEELLSALSACGRLFGAWEITHGKPPTAPSNPSSECFTNACSRQFFVGQREIRGMHASMGTALSCLGFQSGVRDFRGNVTVENGGQEQFKSDGGGS